MRTRTILILTLILLLGIGLVAYFMLLAGGTASETRTSFFPDWFGGGGSNPSGGNGAEIPLDSQENEDAQTPSQNQAALLQLSAEPVAGFVVVSETARFVDRATGNVHETSLITGQKARLSNVTIPKVAQAFFSKNGTQVVLQYLNDERSAPQTFLATVSTSQSTTSASSLDGTFIPAQVTAVAPHPIGSNFFYLTKESSGSRGYIVGATPPGQSIFSSPVTGWQAQWVTPEEVALTTKPSSVSSGFMYFLNTSTGALRRVIGSVPGLTTLVSPDGKRVLMAGAGNPGIRLFVLTPELETPALELPLATLPEKCVWSRTRETIVYCAVPNFLPPGSYPDAWYMGEVAFTDTLYEIDTATAETRFITDFRAYDPNLFIDLLEPALTENDYLLVFKNKLDNSLWRLDLIAL
jgi:hypothetical protein